MHPFIHADKPGNCPVCGMTLVPVYAEEMSNQNTSETQKSESPALHLSLEKQQRIGIQTIEVEKKPLVREITASGRIAFHPDLFVAQQEYLSVLNTPNGALGNLQQELTQSAKTRLKLLGMSEMQIKQLRSADENLLIPQKGKNVWIYGTLYESDLPWIKVGDSVEVFVPGSDDPLLSKIESVNPTIDAVTRTLEFRLRIPNTLENLKPDLYVKLKIHAVGAPSAGPLLVIPENAILSTGNQNLVFVDLGEGKFEPRSLKMGKRGTDEVEVLSGLSAGERVVTHANFLLDSESKLKASISGMEGHSH